MSDIYNGTKTAFLDGGSGQPTYAADEVPISLTDDTIGVILGSDDTSYTFGASDGNYVGDILDGGTTATEFTGTYTPQNLGSKTITQDATNNRAEFDAADVTFTGLDNDTIQFALLGEQGPDSADWTTYSDDPLIAYITSSDFPLTANGGDVTISWDAEGIVHIT